MAICKRCGATTAGLMTLCDACIEAGGATRHTQYSGKVEAEFEAKAKRVLLTTAPTLEGYRITETIEVITAECVFGVNVFRDMMTALTDIFGGRSETSQKVLRDARKTCLRELKKEAAQIGADAVIAMDLDYSEFSGGGKSMLFLVASGTAVRIERLSTSEE